MKPFCETIVQTILPGVRALIAKNLMEKYNMTQQEVAVKISVSQAAVSQYRRDIRGFKVKFLQKDKDVVKKIEGVAGKIAASDLTFPELHEELCSLCRLIRKKKIICEIHMNCIPDGKCSFCSGMVC